MRSLPLLALLLFLPGAGVAQTPDSGEAREAKGRRAWLVATHIPKDLENPVTVLVGDEFHEVTLSKRSASPAIAIHNEQALRLVRKVPNPEKPGEFTLSVLAQAIIPENVQQALVILIPAKEPGKDIEFIAMVQDLAKYRGGDYLFLNLSPTKVAIRLGDQKLGAEPGGIAIYDASSIKSSTNAEISYHYLDQASNEWKLISASTVVVRPTRRELCIFTWNNNFNRINYHGITFPVEP